MKKLLIKRLFCIISLVAIIMSFSPVSLSVRGISTNVDDFSLSVSTLSTQDIFWPPNSSEWTEVAPEEQGLNSSKIAEMFEFIETNSYDIHSVIIARNGYLLTEEYFWESQIYRNPDGSKSYPWDLFHEQTSATKSFMSTLIGIALQEGYLDNINQTLYEFFANIWSPSFPNSTLKKNITIEQLLTHNSGLVADGHLYPSGGTVGTRIDMIKWALDLPLIFTPGQAGEFHYSSDGPNLLSGIITNVTGKSTEEFAKEYLFEPLGISEEEYNWMHDLNNISYGGYFFQCSPKVQAKLGILYLNNGTWNGTQIVDKDFLKEATTDQTGFSCGYLWWIMNSPFEGYEAAGFGGQVIYVIPEFDIVVAFTAGEFDNAPDYDTMLSDYILYQITDPPENGPNNPRIPGFDFSMLFLMIFCASAVLIIRRKKNSKN
ncbi:MAG: serine hydrolase [Candidatus Neomarinimicrobiota bacterium]